ncbi:MAG: exopolysaccharide biosynthesis polyprenyl glycosylphosphotransferase [Nitrospiraceae bacterium]|nr:exopolysaccharide biosynthesis polyprenyl glycosylphosphotransferase [Nitrospiraceae bacterium]
MASSQLAYETQGKSFRGKKGGLLSAAFMSDSILLSGGLFLADCVCAFGAALLATRFEMVREGGESLWEAFGARAAYLVAFLLAWFIAGTRQRLFASIRKESLPFQWLAVLKAVALSLVFTGFSVAFFTRYGAEPGYLLTLGILALLFIGLFRSFVCMALWTIHEWGYNARHVLLVGVNPRTRHLVDTIGTHTRYGYHLVGVLEDEEGRVPILSEYDVPYLGKFEKLEQILTDQIVDEVHVCLPVRSCYELIQSMAHLCVGVGVSVRLVADLFPLRLATSRVYNLADIPMLSLSTVPENSFQLAVKRFIDIVVSLAFLIVFAPFFFLLAVLIKLDSHGPVLYSQERVGMNQRRFKMLKFRSMVADAEKRREELAELNEVDGPAFKIKEDPRVTRVGRFIRKHSLDEFPQLLNVLKGEMSLVGPRPPLVDEVGGYTWDQRRRLSVKPGMTGLWQISGRNDVGFKEWVELDLVYIDNWSVMQDFRILAKTFGVVVFGKGAS